jgi:hypothetical protein
MVISKTVLEEESRQARQAQPPPIPLSLGDAALSYGDDPPERAPKPLRAVLIALTFSAALTSGIVWAVLRAAAAAD